jgi:hypothetical protein
MVLVFCEKQVVRDMLHASNQRVGMQLPVLEYAGAGLVSHVYALADCTG